MPAFLDVEIEELAAAREGRTQLQFNEWFDSSQVKARYKKECMESQQLRCCYCYKFQDTTNNNNWDLEHILDESTYPQFFAEPLNLSITCKRCNGAKSNTDVLCLTIERPPLTLPKLATAYIIPHPWLTTWTEHVRHTDYLYYVGLSVAGKTLVKLCKLNKLALEQAKLPPEAVEIAAVNDFFDVLNPHLSSDISFDEALRLSARIIAKAENRRREAQMAPLRKTLGSFERAARRRAADCDPT